MKTLEFLKAQFLVLLYINKLPDDVILNIIICANDTSLYSKCEKVYAFWQQLDFNTGKTQHESSDQSNNSDSIDVKMGGSVLKEKSFFIMLVQYYLSLLKWIGALTFTLFLKPPPRKLQP